MDEGSFCRSMRDATAFGTQAYECGNVYNPAVSTLLGDTACKHASQGRASQHWYGACGPKVLGLAHLNLQKGTAFIPSRIIYKDIQSTKRRSHGVYRGVNRYRFNLIHLDN